MTCSNCACFEVCNKLSLMCKSIVFTHTRINLGLITIMAQQCSSYTPKKLRNKPNNKQDQLDLMGVQ